MRLHLIAGTSVLFFAAFGAQAGTFSGGSWMPSNCGAAPTAPTIDMTSEKTFSASLNLQDKFTDQNDKYIKCMSDEAHADSEVLSKSAEALKAHQQEVSSGLDADVDKGLAKFGKKK